MKPVEIRLVGRYKVQQRVQGNHEHMIYRGLHTQTFERLFMKGEQARARTRDDKLTILQQGKVLQVTQGGAGIPHMHWCGQEEEYCFLVVQWLGEHLANAKMRCGGSFSRKTILMLALDLLPAIQYLQFKGFCHNQFSPHTIMVGSGSRILLTDFGGTSRFKDINSVHVIPNPNALPRFLNLQFSSLSFNLGQSATRKDDLQSMLYVLAYLETGSLPWSNVTTDTSISENQKIKKVLKLKEETPSQVIFAGNKQLELLFKYTRGLQFDEKPRYMYYRNVLLQKLENIGALDDKIYDWILLEQPLLPDINEPEIQFTANQRQFLMQLQEEINSQQNKEQQPHVQTKGRQTNSTQNLKSKAKECLIY